MFKKIAIAALLATAVFTQNGVLVGGYREVDQQALAQLQQNDAMFSKVDKTARDAYHAKNNGELGNLISVAQQVVAGINYKLTYQTENGQYEVTVFAQPWTETYQATEMKPVINRQ